MRIPVALLLMLTIAASWPGGCPDAPATPARRARTRRGAAAPATRTEPAMFDCPSLLGEGVADEALVLRRADRPRSRRRHHHHAAAAHRPVTLTFDLHNRHTYSEELIKTNRAYRRTPRRSAC